MKTRCCLLVLALAMIVPVCFSAQAPLSPALSDDLSVRSVPGFCWEPCWEYYMSCLGDDPTPIQQGICRSDFDFCLGTWPACVPPVG